MLGKLTWACELVSSKPVPQKESHTMWVLSERTCTLYTLRVICKTRGCLTRSGDETVTLPRRTCMCAYVQLAIVNQSVISSAGDSTHPTLAHNHGNNREPWKELKCSTQTHFHYLGTVCSLLHFCNWPTVPLYSECPQTLDRDMVLYALRVLK